MTDVQTKRLRAGDREEAHAVFAVMSSVFEVEQQPLSDVYLDRLLARDDFWIFAASVDGGIVGGLTAHTLPMTRSESSEIFIFDLAVHPDHQRRGVGRRLMAALLEGAAAAEIDVAFVPADDEDTHALDFYRAIGGVPSPVTIFSFDVSAGR